VARIDVVMPQMGESIAEGTLSKWLKKVGDQVKRDEPMFEISTDKVDAEIPAPSTGVLAEVLVTEGQTVPVQTVVARLETDVTAAVAAPAAAPSAPAAAAAPAGQGAAVGGGAGGPPRKESRPQPPAPSHPIAASAPISAHTNGDSLEELWHEHRDVCALLGRHSGFLGELAQRRARAVEVGVDLRVNVTADEAASRDEQHADQRNVAVQRAEGEVRMEQDQHGPEDAEQHVHAEPVSGRAEVAHEPQLLAQRVQQQHRHQARADDPEPIADASQWVDEMPLAVEQPADEHRERGDRVAELRGLAHREAPLLDRPLVERVRFAAKTYVRADGCHVVCAQKLLLLTLWQPDWPQFCLFAGGVPPWPFLY